MAIHRGCVRGRAGSTGRGGQSVSNSSGTLGGYGNLFSYIGFYEGMDPVKPLEEYLRNFHFSVKQVRQMGQGLTVKLNWFNLNTIKALSAMPWEEGNSWVMGIERGISGFGHYMYDLASGKGRSKAAIQRNSPAGGVTAFSTKRYLPTMLEEARRRIRKI